MKIQKRRYNNVRTDRDKHNGASGAFEEANALPVANICYVSDLDPAVETGKLETCGLRRTEGGLYIKDGEIKFDKYLESDGSQYIITDVIPNKDTKIVLICPLSAGTKRRWCLDQE